MGGCTRVSRDECPPPAHIVQDIGTPDPVVPSQPCRFEHAGYTDAHVFQFYFFDYSRPVRFTCCGTSVAVQDHQAAIRNGCFQSGRATTIPVRSEGGQVVGYRDDRPNSHWLEIEMAASHFLPGHVCRDDAAWWLDYTSRSWFDVHGKCQAILSSRSCGFTTRPHSYGCGSKACPLWRIKCSAFLSARATP